MLRKLLKYEFRATSKIMGAILGGSVAASALGYFLIFVLIDPRMIPAIEGRNRLLYQLATAMLGLLTFFVYLAAYSAFILAIIMLLRRFYRNFFTDEGYLTFTLPTTTHSLLWAKIISGFVWMILAILTLLICAVSLVLGIAMPTGQWDLTGLWEVLPVLKESFVEVFGTDSAITVILIIVLCIVSLLYSMIPFYFSLSLGSMIAKKHKVWASVGMYFALSTVVGWIESLIVIIFFGAEALLQGGIAENTIGSLVLSICLILGLGTAEYLLTNLILKKKLNLN